MRFLKWSVFLRNTGSQKTQAVFSNKMRIMTFKDIKYKYRRQHQRARFKNYDQFKNLRISIRDSSLALILVGKWKRTGRCLTSAFLTIKRRFLSRKSFIWSSKNQTVLDCNKTKGVRMGGGKGKHFKPKMLYSAGEVMFRINTHKDQKAMLTSALLKSSLRFGFKGRVFAY